MTKKLAARTPRAVTRQPGARSLDWSLTLGSAQLIVILLLLPFVVFWAETIGLRVFYHHDLQYYFFPYHKLVADITAQGRLPLWNPYAFSGIPLLGDGQTAIFYPPNWLFWLLPPAHALTVVVLLQFSLAGAGMFAYVRSLRLSRLAAFVAALAFMFNGFLVARVVHLSIMAGAALIPALFWGFERLLQRPSLRSFALAAALVCVQALAGHPQTPIYTAVALGVYALTLSFQSWRARARRGWRALLPLAQLAAIYVVGYALAAIQLAPWIEFATFSPRAAGASYDFVTSQSLARFDWWLLLFPYGYGGIQQGWLQSTPAWDLPVYLWERLAYVGLLPLALAGLGLVELRRLGAQTHAAAARRGAIDPAERDRARLQYGRLWALTAALIVTLLIAAGSSTPFGRLVYALPVIGKLRAYARAIAVSCFVLAALAAYGLERLRSHRGRRGDSAAVVAGAALAGVVTLALIVANVIGADGFSSAQREPMYTVMLDRSLQLTEANAYAPLLLALLSAAALWWCSFGLTRARSAVLVGLIAVDLLSFAVSFNPTTDPAVFAQTPESVTFLREDRDLFRTASFVRDDRIPPGLAAQQLAISWAIPYGIEDINGFNSLQPRRYTDFLFGPQVEDVSYGFLVDPRLLDPSNRLLSMLNVKYAVVQPQSGITPPLVAPAERLYEPDGLERSWQRVFQTANVTIYRNPNVYPRAFFADRVAAVPDPSTILALIKQPGYDPRQQSFVESGLTQAEAQRLSQPAGGTVDVERVAPDELRLHTQSSSARFVVLSEMWLPGWRAELDGQQLPIYRTNYLFRGLVVPAGEHTIRMVYRPTSAIVGAAITLATLAALLVGLMASRRPANAIQRRALHEGARR
jgi:hypothetical protein